jgi:hypothetical protein
MGHAKLHEDDDIDGEAEVTEYKRMVTTALGWR